MKKYTKHLTLVAFLFIVFHATAQQRNNYNPDYSRTKKAKEITKEIDRFVQDNLEKYDLSPKREAQVRKKFTGNEKVFSTSAAALQNALLEAKVNELHRLYFMQFPDEASYFQVDNVENRYVCDNGGFEDGYTDDYVFGHAMLLEFEASCNMLRPGLDDLTPLGLNDFDAEVTLVNNDGSVFGGNDPGLASLSVPVNIPRIHTGNSAIKLNNNSPLSGVTSMTKEFKVDGPIVSFYYSMIAQNPLDHSADEQPHFIARLYDADGNIIDQACIVPTMTDNRFANADNHPTAPLLYTGWQCQKLSTEGLEYGELAKLVFIITDCGQAAHYGTVYIDDICNSPDCINNMGSVTVNPNGTINCPALPINICGNYVLPTTIAEPVVTGTLQNLTLKIKQGAVTVATLTSYTLSAGNRFCFEAEDADFATPPVGDFEYEVSVGFLLNGTSFTLTDSSAVAGPDVTFQNCIECDDFLTIATDVSSGEDVQQAGIGITALNTISGAAYAEYHAGSQVLLSPGFDILPAAEGYFHIEGCVSEDAGEEPVEQENPIVREENPIELVERGKNRSLWVYPNPATTTVEIKVDGGEQLQEVSLISLEGKTVLNKRAGEELGLGKNTYKMDVSSVTNGFYLLTVKTSDGETTSAKIIKK